MLRTIQDDRGFQGFGWLAARFGLKPILRRVWSPQGERPVAEVDVRYEWLWLYAATHPRTVRVFWLVLPRLDAACVQVFLT